MLVGDFLELLGVTLLFVTDTPSPHHRGAERQLQDFAPGELMPTGDVAALATKAFTAAFKIGVQLAAPFLVFGLVFNMGLGILARLMPQMQVYFVGVPLSILIGFLIFAAVLTTMMGTYLDYFVGVMQQLTPRHRIGEVDRWPTTNQEKTQDPTQKKLDDAHQRGDVAKSQEVNTWFLIAGATLVMSTFHSSIGGGLEAPLRNLLRTPG